MRRTAVASAAAWLAACAPAVAGPTDRELLGRHLPVLRYDASEDYYAQPVSLPPQTAEMRPGDRVYGHVAAEGRERWLQYWFFYAYNPQDRGVLRIGRHEGDWELFQVRLDDGGRPDLVTMTQHSWAEGCAWDDIQRTGDGGSPVLYVANGSHAIYRDAGDHDRPFPDPTDEADGAGREAAPRLAVIEDGDPAWVDYPGPWGETEAGPVPGESSSPRGPRFHEGDPWASPASFHAERARPCGSGAPGRWWGIPLLAAAVALAAGLALLGVRALRA